jgi:hypothetical protein
MNSLSRGFWLAVSAALLGGCGQGHITLNIKSPPGTNHGRPLYMIVRKVDPKQYSTEAYNDVAAKVVNPDATVLRSEVIYPGTLQRIPVNMPKEEPVAVSFLFTAPDGSWQMLLNKLAPSTVNIELLEGRIRTNADAAAPEEEEAPPAPPKVALPKVAAPTE